MAPVAGKGDYYEVLGVRRDASLEQIKSAYRKAALQHHPDRNPGDIQAEARFKEAAEAYAVLADPERRRRYDQFGHEGLGGGAGFDPTVFADFEDLFGGIFAEFFGMNARRAQSRGGQAARARGQDLRYDLAIDFEEAVHGTEAQIRVPHSESCSACAGSRAASSADIATCQTCHGTGQQRTTHGFFTIARTCSQCRGHGQTIRKVCPTCRGAGEVQSESTLKVPIPAGVESGSRLRLSGEGDAGSGGGPRGDLYVYVSVREHPIFRRDGLDLLCTVPITFSQAALGAQIKLEGLNGTEKIKVPAGTQTGAVIRLKGKGVPNPHGFNRGDLVVDVVVRTPTRLSREGSKILERLAELGDEDFPESDRPIRDRIK